MVKRKYAQDYQLQHIRELGHLLFVKLQAAADETQLDFRRLFRRQAGRLRQTVLTAEPYAPFTFSWK